MGYNFEVRKMKLVIQRCSNATVEVDNKIVGSIDKGFVVFVGFKTGDTLKDLEYATKKMCGLRIFTDENDKMNLSPLQIGAELLIISNFSLYANTKHGFRPDFLESMPPHEANAMYEKFKTMCKESNQFKKVECGIFGADMKVKVLNDGPINIIIDTGDIK